MTQRINQYGTAAIAHDSAIAAVKAINGDDGYVILPPYWLEANKRVTVLAPGHGQLSDNSAVDYEAFKDAVRDLIASAETAAVELAGEPAREIFWREFATRNETRSGKIWED